MLTDATFIDPLITTLILATSSAAICCAVAAPMGWLVARTDMPLRTHRARAGDGIVRDAAVPRRHRLGDARRAQQRAAQPGSTARVTGAEPDEHLFNIYTLPGLIFVISCYTFPYVFVLVANALDRMPGDLEDASRSSAAAPGRPRGASPCRCALPALVAGALVAFLQAMTLFGSPAILALPAGFHTMTTKIWSLFQYPPKPELAAAASLPLLVLTIVLLRGEHLVLGRRGYSVVGGKQGAPRLVRLGRWSWVGARGHLHRAAAMPGVPALRRAAQCVVLAGRHAARVARHISRLHNVAFRVLRTVGDAARASRTRSSWARWRRPSAPRWRW